MKGMQLLAGLALVCLLGACSYSATVEAYNWTDSPPRDVECEVDGTAKIVPGEMDEYPWMASWDIKWPTSGSDSREIGVRVRELGGAWSNTVLDTVVHQDVLYVDIYEGVFYVSKGQGQSLEVRTSTQPPDLERIRSLKEAAGE